MVRIGPALETFLTVVGAVLLVLVGIGLLTRPFWKRITQFFRRWYERDRRLEQQQREEAECRRKAQQEIGEYCHDDILQGKVAPSSQTAAGTVLPQAAAGTAESRQAEVETAEVEVKVGESAFAENSVIEARDGSGRVAQAAEAQTLQAGRSAGRKEDSNEA